MKINRPTGPFDWETFSVGDIVSRDGTDRQRVVGVSHSGQVIEVECIQAPSSGWCEVGETESNMARRYHFADEAIDATDLNS